MRQFSVQSDAQELGKLNKYRVIGEFKEQLYDQNWTSYDGGRKKVKIFLKSVGNYQLIRSTCRVEYVMGPEI